MKIDVEADLIQRAQGGELVALEAVLRGIQAPVYNLAVRMLGRRDDAQDATQEILLKVTTHLGGWRGESAFGTWVYSIAGNHLINARSRSPHRHEVSFDELGEQLDRGLAYAERIGFDGHALTPEDKLEARRTALSCTQAMLTCLDAPGRLAYVLDEIFGLESPAAAEVQGITPAAHRQRLARARHAVHGFMAGRCGLVSADAPCRCVRQLPGKRAAAARGRALPGLAVGPEELDEASQALQELTALGDAAAVLRGAPEYRAPDAMLQGIRLVVAHCGMLRQ
jgi:RNA polymerase sigma factor (sigma-70 family)